MKKEISGNLIDYLNNNGNFIAEQPELIQQLITYQTISSYLTVILMLVLIIASACTALYFWKNPSVDKDGYKTGPSSAGTIVPLVLIPFFFIQLCSSADNLIKIHLAPKMFLIESCVNKKNN